MLEVLRRIPGKFVMYVAKKDVGDAADTLQMCLGQDARADIAIQAMHNPFQYDEIEAVLLTDAENAFNREVMMCNISIMCLILSTFISSCSFVPARLFVIGNMEVISKEGTTQRDPLAMGTYALGVKPCLILVKKSHLWMISLLLET